MFHTVLMKTFQESKFFRNFRAFGRRRHVPTNISVSRAVLTPSSDFNDTKTSSGGG